MPKRANTNAPQKAGAEPDYVKSGNNAGREQDHRAVDDEQEESQGEDAQWESDDLEEEAHRGVEQADDQRGDQRRDQAGHVESGDEMGNDDERDGAQDPMEKKPHAFSLRLICRANSNSRCSMPKCVNIGGRDLNRAGRSI